jgi:uncharacterized protein DUF6411
MVIAAAIGCCLLVLILAFVLPRLSQGVERGVKLPFGLGQRAGSKAPGKAGELAQKPFGKAKQAIGRSGSKGRRERAKAPF